MLTFYINDKTSQTRNFFKAKKEKKNVEKEIGSFAFRIDNLTQAQALVDHAEDLGLSVDNLNYAGYGDYITFGVSDSKDISYEEYFDDIPTGVETILRREYKSQRDYITAIVDAIEDMATAKQALLLIDTIREKTYRELALGKGGVVKTKQQPKKETKPSKGGISLVTVSDHFIIDDINDEIITCKRPNDKVKFYFSV